MCLLAAALSTMIWSQGRACNVPVFRYALERWDADLYPVLLYYNGELDEELFSQLQQRCAGRDSLLNASIERIDASTEQGASRAARAGIGQFPWIQVYYPPASSVRGLVWEGVFDRANVERLLDSPARTALAQRLLDGEASVWVLVKSGDGHKDRRASETLRAELERASEQLKVPETGVDIDGNPIEVSDFRNYPVRFSLIEISGTDPDEILLVSMLKGSEADLVLYDEPLAFPVYGRGRALYALVGKGINQSTIFAACQSVISWCSCEIKAQNPGIDLLVSADWSHPRGGAMVKDEALPPLTGLSGFLSADDPEHSVSTQAEAGQDDPVSAGAGEPGSGTAPRPEGSHAIFSRPLYRNLILSAAAGLVLVLAASVVLKARKKE